MKGFSFEMFPLVSGKSAPQLTITQTTSTTSPFIPSTTIKSVSLPSSSFSTPTSLYAGLGAYEQMQVSGPMTLTRPQTSQPQVIKQPTLNMTPNFKLTLEPKIKTSVRSRGRIESKPKELFKEPEKLLDKVKETQKTESKFDSGLRSKQLSKLKQLSRLKQKMQEVTITPTTTTMSYAPQITKPFTPKGSVSSLIDKVKKGKLFDVYVRKEGQDIKLGSYKTIKEAKSKLTGTLGQKLRASGFIEVDGKKLKVKALKIFNPQFRTSKVDSFRLVEKKSRRLKRGTQETSEIIGFRKSPSKKKSKKRLWGV